ncbi:DsbA family protein [Dyella sp.]|uniref:DsbA family protein n=1 Tax=Dyella sp. TaxID=1869338 RepID=UPI002B45F2ED|nr:DsbA family protein [Dyella sp.]HKT28882.1 DsbA family protein [Dyella sp.]
MIKTLHYLFDPLCGWCYGAMPALAALATEADLRVEPLPTGLFSGERARPMDEGFADYAWSNDQRIERLTGQPFTERYRSQVLADRTRLFDSGPATVALTAVSLTEPARELEMLKAMQAARYVEGRDITDLRVLADLLQQRSLADAAMQLEQGSPALLAAHHARTARANAWMGELGAHGVPTLVLQTGATRTLLNTSAIYTHPSALLDQLRAA